MTQPAPSRPDVVLLDVNETLTDMGTLRARFEEAGLPGDLMPAWFAGVLRDGFALTAAGGYASFGDIAADVLRGLLVPGRASDAEDGISRILGAFADLPLHPDVAEGMRMLRRAGVRLFTLTNGAAATTERILQREGLVDLVEARLDVSGPRAWKPARAAYEYAIGRTGVLPDQAALVAVHPWDIDGAQRAGLTGAWLNRLGTPYPSVMTAPLVSAPDLVALAALWLDV